VVRAVFVLQPSRVNGTDSAVGMNQYADVLRQLDRSLSHATMDFDRQISLTISAEVNVQLAGSQIDFEPGGQLVTGACLRTAGIDL